MKNLVDFNFDSEIDDRVLTRTPAEQLTPAHVVTAVHLPGKWVVSAFTYGIVLEEADFVENSFYILWSGGQGGHVTWQVVLMSIDMDRSFREGKCRWGQESEVINRALHELTYNWHAIPADSRPAK